MIVWPYSPWSPQSLGKLDSTVPRVGIDSIQLLQFSHVLPHKVSYN